MKIYLASSWKNAEQVKSIKDMLEAEGNEVDAFCDSTAGRFVFRFDQLSANLSEHNAITIFNFPPVNQAFEEDKKWLDWADAVLLILPAGKSAHLEAGYAKGQGKHLVIYQDGFPDGEFDVMYGFADLITDDLHEVTAYFRQQDSTVQDAEIVNEHDEMKQLRSIR